MLILPPHFEKAFPGSRDIFTRIFNIEGTVFREVAGRRTLQFSCEGKPYFLKTHSGVGWKEIFKNLLQFKWPVLGARQEWEASHRLNELGIATPIPVGFGCRGKNPAHQQSFLITEDLGESLTLEELLARWRWSKTSGREYLKLKWTFIQAVATIARTMHQHGMNHCDFYLCHLRIKRENLLSNGLRPSAPLFVMDLHRAQIRKKTPPRWIVKDLGALLFSCLPFGITTQDQCRFLKVYAGMSLRDAFNTQGKLWNRVQRRARRMYDKHGAPQLRAGLLGPTAENLHEPT
ncbi:MAG: lipopolysaccharide core heptose(I) kinase RfaP [Nitrospirales bacterium]